MSKRKYPPISGYPGICRVLVMSKGGSWSEPKRGKRFRAEKYVKGADGPPIRKFAFFDTFVQAKAFRANTVQITQRESAKGMSFKDLVQVWKSVWLPNKDMSTQIRYGSYLQHFDFFMEMTVDSIEPKDV